uniref:Uncharacterized protein n=1 Tax=Oryza punctata TaxID=4537 RepID=A0A0E0LU27_ORYPU
MQASVAVWEALEAGKLSAVPGDGAADFAVAWLAVVVVSLAVAATCVVVSFDERARQPGRLRRMLDLGPSMRGARLLLAIFAGLLAAAEVLRLPFFRRLVVAYALVALVVVPLPVQVVALALTSVWETPRRTSQIAGFVGFLAVGIASAASLAILVLLPVYDALVLGDEEQLPVAVAAAGEEARELDR